MDTWCAFVEAGPLPNSRIRVKGLLRSDRTTVRIRENIYVDVNRQFESITNVIDTHWQYAELDSTQQRG